MQSDIIRIVMDLLQSGAIRLGLALTARQLDLFETYYHQLISWNQWVNLTTITGYESVQNQHFLDSLTVAVALNSPTHKGIGLLDVGAGAGFPGIPLGIAFPEIIVTLLEATSKKVEFLRHVISALNLNNVSVINGRAEEIAHQPDYREQFDFVTARALAELPVLLELTLPFCRTGGRVVAQKKGALETELVNSAKAMTVLGGKLDGVKAVSLPELPDERCLVIVEKVAPTPPKYPRRPGMPAKKPLL
jgi:16S rRNA (guanine527-N7)-methyltransferase